MSPNLGVGIRFSGCGDTRGPRYTAQCSRLGSLRQPRSPHRRTEMAIAYLIETWNGHETLTYDCVLLLALIELKMVAAVKVCAW